MAPSTRSNPALTKKIATLQLTLAPFVPLPHGLPHPDFPRTLFAFHLLTEDQLDKLAHYYHQSTPGPWTMQYPTTMNWSKEFLAKPTPTSLELTQRRLSLQDEQLLSDIMQTINDISSRRRSLDVNYTKLSDRDRIRIKRRKVGKFIGLQLVLTTTNYYTLYTVSQTTINMNIGRSHSVRSKQSESSTSKLTSHFKLSSLRGIQQPELSKKLYKLIKAQNQVIGAYESAGRESSAIAGQLSDWGESTEDEALSDISDKLAVLLSEIADQEESFSQNLEESRVVLKEIRDVEKSVQPTRDHKTKIADEIQKLKYKEPESTKLVGLEQELVRAEAQSLVAEAQLTNITRQKFKESFDLHSAAVIERAEKQILLAKAARQVIALLSDAPIVPGEERPTYQESEEARQILNEAESGLRSWTPKYDTIHSGGQLGTNAMPVASESTAAPTSEHLATEETAVKTESAPIAA